MTDNPESANQLRRLDELITHNYSYVVFQALRKAKAELSSQATATIDIPELDLEIEISRHSFESMLTPLLAEIDGLINETLHEAGVDEEAVSLVIRTGGSSLIACIRDRLNHIFPGKVVEHDPFTSVAAGLAVASYHGLTY